jgi:hypothetical protein
MKRLTITVAGLAVFLFVVTASAGQPSLFDRYETVRQALLSGSLDDIQRTANDLADTASASRQKRIAERASALATAADLKSARDSFAMLSEEVIDYRDGRSGPRPVVVYCSMEKKSWLQPKGGISNPYMDESMRSCGEVRKDMPVAAPADHSDHH